MRRWPQWRLRGPLRQTLAEGTGTVWLPAWDLRFGVDWNRPRMTRRGWSLVYGVFWMSRLRPRLREGEVIYARTWSLRFDWPVRLYWRETYRRWPKREICRVDYWTPRGWKCRATNQS